MRRFLLGMLALAACGGGADEEFGMRSSELSSKAFRLLHDSPPGGCDNREYAGDGDWYPNYCKTECNTPATAISSSFAASASCGTILAVFPLDPPPGPSAEEFTHKLACNNGISFGGPAVDVTNGYTLHFGNGNDQRFPTVGYDWAPGLRKGECDSSHAITGLASDNVFHGNRACGFWIFTSDSGYAYGVVGARCSALTSPPGTYPAATNCAVMDFTNGDAREPNASGDWDSGFLKGECGDGRYIKGVAVGGFGNGSRRVTKILCCSPSYPTIPG